MRFFQNCWTFLALYFVSIQFLHMFLYIVTSNRHNVEKKKSPLERHSAPFLGGKEEEVRLSNFIFSFVSVFFKNKIENMWND